MRGTFEWVPFIHKITDASAVEPFAHRYNGMLWRVGGMHGLAVIAVEWLVERVQLLLGASELTPGGVGHLYLAGPAGSSTWPSRRRSTHRSPPAASRSSAR